MKNTLSELRSIIAGLLPLAIHLTETDNGSGLPLSEETSDLLERAKLAAAATDDGPRIPLDATETEILAWLEAKCASYGIPGLDMMLRNAKLSGGPAYLQILTNAPNASNYASGERRTRSQRT